MAQNELIHKHTNTIKGLETSITIISIPEDIVIATNQTLLTVQTLDMMQ
jgi:hypothetical protein